MEEKGLFEQLKKNKKIDYSYSKGITRMHIFLAVGYVFKTLIPGSYYVCKTEEDVYESIAHFKFLRKYNLV